ncbi:xylose repressor [Spirochaetia bacterium]|nr:xylose repressor [Spirochaetia bacterium]
MKIVDFMQERGIVYDDVKENSKALGRKPTPVRFNRNFAYIIAIYMEGVYTSIGIVNILGDVIFSREIEIANAEQFIQKDFYNYIDSTILQSAVEREKLIGIGIALPVAVDYAGKKVLRAPLFRETHLEDLPIILERLGTLYSLPVFVENDVNSAAYGEYRQIYSESTDNLIYISLGSGVGSGIILNKEIWKGQNSSAGEIGYMIFEKNRSFPQDGPGWLESKINFTALQESFNTNIQNIIPKQTKQKIARYFAKYLSLSILNMYVVLDIQTVVLGGKLTEYLSDVLIDEVYREMRAISSLMPQLVYGSLKKPGFSGLSYLITDKLMDQILTVSS